MSRTSAALPGGGGLGIPIGGGTGGLGIGVILILAVIGYFTGIDPRILIGGAQIVMGNGGNGVSYSTRRRPRRRRARCSRCRTRRTIRCSSFVKKILGETEDVWSQVLPAQKGVDYVAPKLVLYSGSIRSGCGQAQSAMGPFYCPNDKKVYLDMSFFNDMKAKYGGGGDFAYAYVIAHEVGHHVQDQLGILDKADEAKQNAQPHPGQRDFGAHRIDGRLSRRRLGGERRSEMAHS